MSSSRQLALVLVVSLCACVKPSHQDPPSPASADVPSAEPEPARELGSSRFWVQTGALEAYDLDGKLVETAEFGELGDFAVALDDGRLLTVIGIGDGAATRVVIVSTDGQQREEIELPILFDHDHCELRPAKPGEVEAIEAAWTNNTPGPRGVALSLQSRDELRLGENGTVVCMSLMESDSRVANYNVTVAVDLHSGQIASALDYDAGDNCPKQEPPPGCESYLRLQPWVEGPTVTTKRAWPLHLDETSGWLLDEAGAQVRDLCRAGSREDRDFVPDWTTCGQTHTESSTGRWQLLWANVEEGDYLYYELIFLDLDRGDLWNVVELEGGHHWELLEGQGAFEGETAFVGPEVSHPLAFHTGVEVVALPLDRFWIDGALYIPERQEVVSIGGSLAQTAPGVAP